VEVAEIAEKRKRAMGFKKPTEGSLRILSVLRGKISVRCIDDHEY
jgi:hypothetical protein